MARPNGSKKNGFLLLYKLEYQLTCGCIAQILSPNCHLRPRFVSLHNYSTAHPQLVIESPRVICV